MKQTAFICFFFLLIVTGVQAQSTPTPDPAASPASFEEEKRKLELERLELENEKLKLETEKLKLQATQTVEGKPESKGRQDSTKEIELFQTQISEKAEAFARENKAKENLLVLDLVNGEVWFKGIRYSAHDIYTMAEEQKLKMKKRLDKRDMDGDERNLYIFQNVSLLRYDRRSRGILDIKTPSKDEDFQILTPEGISFNSSIGDVRNAYQGVYFKYDGDGERGKLKLLKYKHSAGFSFADELEFAFDREGKMVEIRYGVLGEN